jgi:hypothetical protein
LGLGPTFLSVGLPRSRPGGYTQRSRSSSVPFGTPQKAIFMALWRCADFCWPTGPCHACRSTSSPGDPGSGRVVDVRVLLGMEGGVGHAEARRRRAVVRSRPPVVRWRWLGSRVLLVVVVGEVEAASERIVRGTHRLAVRGGAGERCGREVHGEPQHVELLAL